jgi:hypothetical protein
MPNSWDEMLMITLLDWYVVQVKQIQASLNSILRKKYHWTWARSGRWKAQTTFQWLLCRWFSFELVFLTPVFENPNMLNCFLLLFHHQTGERQDGYCAIKKWKMSNRVENRIAYFCRILYTKYVMHPQICNKKIKMYRLVYTNH